jgi:prolyl-tRNA editing enzyme YbaK/EbsC (Cys-tRNA(Pro) deacylase)
MLTDLTMITFAMLTRLGPDLAHVLGELPTLERETVRLVEIECPSLRWIASYAVLGNANYLDVFEAPNVETALKARLVIGAQAHAETEIWPIVEWPRFKRALLTHEQGSRAGRIGERDAATAMSAVVTYLTHHGAAFRLTSYPVPEEEPAIAHRVHLGAQIVSTRVVLVDGRPAIACGPEGVPLDAASLGAAIGASILDGTSKDLPGAFRGVPEPLPPLGHLLGVPLFVDESLGAGDTVVFHAFSRGVYIELGFEDFARIEQPKMVPLAVSGELTAH